MRISNADIRTFHRNNLYNSHASTVNPLPNPMHFFSLRAFRRLTGHGSSGDDDAALDPACKIPLTERNMQFFNQASRGSSSSDDNNNKEDEELSELHVHERRERLYVVRAGRIDEWLEVVSGVRDSSSSVIGLAPLTHPAVLLTSRVCRKEAIDTAVSNKCTDV